MIIKQSILILLLICFNSLKSQIKNPSFEQWSINGTIEEPFDWNTSNLLSSLDSSLSCNKNGHAYWGNYSIAISPIYLPSLMDTLPGFIIQKGAIKNLINSVSIYYRHPSVYISDSPYLYLSLYKNSISK